MVPLVSPHGPLIVSLHFRVFEPRSSAGVRPTRACRGFASGPIWRFGKRRWRNRRAIRGGLHIRLRFAGRPPSTYRLVGVGPSGEPFLRDSLGEPLESRLHVRPGH